MGGALVMNRVVTVTDKEEQGYAVFAVRYGGKSRLTSCTLLIRWSASVLKVGVPFGLRSLQNKTGLYTNACKEAAREAYESNPEKKKEAVRKIYYVNSKR